MNWRVLLAFLGAATLFGEVTSEMLLNSRQHPENWLTYSGGYYSQRFSALDKITRTNVKDLELKWVWRPRYLDKMEAHAAGRGRRPLYGARERCGGAGCA